MITVHRCHCKSARLKNPAENESDKKIQCERFLRLFSYESRKHIGIGQFLKFDKVKAVVAKKKFLNKYPSHYGKTSGS
jgi:hypothetical protein